MKKLLASILLGVFLIQGTAQAVKINGQLVNALLEKKASDPAQGTQGRVWFNTTTGKAKVDNGTAITDLGSGSGSGINYLVGNSSDLESTVGNWLAYKDAAQATPVDGTGGSPTLTCARSTSSPLRGVGSLLVTKDAANRQGEGCGVAFTIDSADQAKVQTVSFDYAVSSGTFDSADFTVYIYDVTNATIIQPSGFSILSAATGLSQRQIATFQTASNSVSYRLLLHVADTTASAWALKLDNISVGPDSKSYGVPASDATSQGVLSITATTSNPTKGTTTIDNYSSSRFADKLHLIFNYTQTAGGAAGSGTYLIGFNAGLSIDVAKYPQGTVVGPASLWNGTNRSTGNIRVYDATHFYATFVSNAVGENEWNSSFYQLSATTVQFFATAVIPIVGWSSNVLMSSDTDTRVVAFSGTSSSTQSVTNTGGDQQVTGYTSINDTLGGFSSNSYTIQVPGYYHIDAAITWSTQASSARAYTAIYKNGILYTLGSQVPLSSSFYATTTAIDLIKLVAGDVIDVRANVTVTTSLISSDQHWNIVRVSGPSAIAATESITARFAKSGTQLFTTGTTAKLTGWTTVKDSHGGFDGTNNRYVFNAPGNYQLAANALGSVSSLILSYKVNGGTAVWIGTGSDGTVLRTGGSALLPGIVAGDYVEIWPYNGNGASNTVSAGDDSTYFTIFRVGN